MELATQQSKPTELAMRTKLAHRMLALRPRSLPETWFRVGPDTEYGRFPRKEEETRVDPHCDCTEFQQRHMFPVNNRKTLGQRRGQAQDEGGLYLRAQ